MPKEREVIIVHLIIYKKRGFFTFLFGLLVARIYQHPNLKPLVAGFTPQMAAYESHTQRRYLHTPLYI